MGAETNHVSYYLARRHYGIVALGGHGGSATLTDVSSNDFEQSVSEGSFFSYLDTDTLDDKHPFFELLFGCSTIKEQNSPGAAALRTCAIGVLGATEPPVTGSWDPNAFYGYGGNPGYVYHTARLLVEAGNTMGEAINWCRANAGNGHEGRFFSNLAMNMYGDPSVGLYSAFMSVKPSAVLWGD